MNAILTACLMLFTAMAEAKSEEDSIPEPTDLSVLAKDATSDIFVASSSESIARGESSARLTAVEVVSADGKRVSGVRLLLHSESRTGKVYLDSNQIVQIRDEFVELERWYKNKQPCNARKRCVQGVARCRPSQTVRQAFCPGFYSTPDGERGVIVSSAGGSFLFESVSPSEFASSVDAAIDDLSGWRAND